MCEKAFPYNVRNTDCQPGIEKSCKIANFPDRALQDKCSHTKKNYLSTWVFKVIFGLKEFIFQKQKCQLVVCVNSDASLCTSVFYIRESCGHAKIRDTF